MATWNGKYSDWINQAGQQNGIDPQLLASIITVESGLNPLAYNTPSGATGLGQFLPSTAKEEGIDPWNPQQSIFGMADYLKKRINQAGSIKGGIMGYGEGTESYFQKVQNAYKDISNGKTITDTGTGTTNVQDAGNNISLNIFGQVKRILIYGAILLIIFFSIYMIYQEGGETA